MVILSEAISTVFKANVKLKAVSEAVMGLAMYR